MMARPFLIACAIVLLAPVAALESGASAAPAASGCRQVAAATDPATPPAPASHDGTAPGNAGSTGWSGGTGGSFIGTTPAGPKSGSNVAQPATAEGLDPIASSPKPAAAKC
jgi:hypothetical protein